MTSIRSIILALAASLATAGTAVAAVPYPDAGTQNPATYTFSATSTGDLSAYFYGSYAGFSESLGVLVNGVDTGLIGLNNHTTTPGAAFSFGKVNAGDTLTFYINVGDYIANRQYTYYSDLALNSDNQHHVYASSYVGGASAFGGSAIPAGTFIGFEDLSLVHDGQSDFNYADQQFVLTNTTVSTPAVPEPATWAMMLAGFGVIGFAAIRRQKVSVTNA